MLVSFYHLQKIFITQTMLAQCCWEEEEEGGGKGAELKPPSFSLYAAFVL